VSAVAASALVVAGAAAIVIALRDQHHAPQPAASAAGTLYRPTTTATIPAPPSTSPSTQPPAPVTTTTAAPVADPVAITIPSLGVHSTLVRLGLNADGSVEVPTSFHVAGWYDRGVAPGANGPAIILGHVDSKSGPGIFFRLGAMHPGDRVDVQRADGSTVAFEITAVRSYTKAAFPSIAVYGNTPTPTIRLITCGGTFDNATGHYLSNTIVFGQAVAGT
jgi:sortase (surface protein transpeptidase)